MSLISNLKIENDSVSFDLNNQTKEIKISFSNALRRTIISNVYTYTISDKSIIFFENTSMLNNEFLKHRLTLVPIVSDLKDINYENVVISCKKKNEGENMENIYVNEFICKDIETDAIIDNNIIFKYPNILFGKLRHNQHISFESRLTRNNAEHGGSFFSPVSKCVYTFKVDNEQVKEITKIMDESQIKTFKSQEIERVYEKNEIGEPNVYNFVVESIGFYQPLHIVILGIDCLVDRLSNIKMELRNAKSKKISLLENTDFFDFSIDDETETIGNLLSTYIAYSKDVAYCGFLIEHPLKKNIILRVKLIPSMDNLENNILIIESNINYLVSLLNKIKMDIQS
jgi:DNA-directed RNA polymerase subunit L